LLAVADVGRHPRLTDEDPSPKRGGPKRQQSMLAGFVIVHCSFCWLVVAVRPHLPPTKQHVQRPPCLSPAIRQNMLGGLVDPESSASAPLEQEIPNTLQVPRRSVLREVRTNHITFPVIDVAP